MRKRQDAPKQAESWMVSRPHTTQATRGHALPTTRGAHYAGPTKISLREETVPDQRCKRAQAKSAGGGVRNCGCRFAERAAHSGDAARQHRGPRQQRRRRLKDNGTVGVNDRNTHRQRQGIARPSPPHTTTDAATDHGTCDTNDTNTYNENTINNTQATQRRQRRR